MDHPDDPHALLDPSLPQDTGLAVLSAGFDADGQPPAQASDAPAGADEQQQQPGPGAHDDDDGYHPHGPGGAFQGELAPDFGQGSQPAQHGGDHPALDGPGGLLAGEPRPSASDDGLSASGGKRRRSHPHNSVELDLSTPEGQAKKKQRALRAAYMREYRKKKSTSKTTGGGKDENGMGVGSSSSQYDDVMMGMGNGYDADKLKQLDINVDPSISVQGNFSYGQLSVNLHNAADAAFHDDLAGGGGAASGSGGGGAYQPRFTTFTHGAHLGQLPVPRLRFLFHLELELDAQRDVGDGPFGKRTTAGIKGGLFEGQTVRGTVVPGGAETLIVDPTTSEAHVDATYTLQTHDGAHVLVRAAGVQTGARDALDGAADGAQLSAGGPSFRLTLALETGDERYKWLNRLVCVASAARSGSLVVYDCFQLA